MSPECARGGKKKLENWLTARRWPRKLERRERLVGGAYVHMERSEPESWRPERYRAMMRLWASITLPAELHRRVDPSDVVQEALLKAHQSRHEFGGTSQPQFRAWLRSIVVNEVRQAIRRETAARRDVHREIEWQDAVEQSSLRLERLLVSDLTPPAEVVEREERLLWFAEALDQLENRHRVVVEMRFFHGLRIVDMAGRLECKSGDVVNRLRTALATLRRMAGTNGRDEP
jgi:RNA polymerase sigma-70 factor (ECF subfamily)